MNSKNKNIKEVFLLSTVELRGLQTLILCCFLYVLTPVVVRHVLKEKSYVSDFRDISLKNETMDSIKNKPSHFSKERKSIKTPLEMFSFNPNELSMEDAQKLGIPLYVYSNIQKYRSKGGIIKSKQQLKNIYGMNSAIYDRIEPFIEFPENLQKSSHFVIKEFPSQIFDLNTLEYKEFIYKLNLDPSLANRIVNYRSALGGFVKIQQLSEVYGMQDSTLNRITPRLTIIQKHRSISLFTTSLDSLAKHPYIKYKLAKLIDKYRKEHGRLNHLSELKHIISDSIQIKKIELYCH